MECNRRSTDGSLALVLKTAEHVKVGSRTFWDWAEKRKIAAHLVMIVALTMTIRVVEWMLDFPYDVLSAAKPYTGIEVAAIQAAVIGPWGLMQGVMFKMYMDMIRSNGNDKAAG